MAACFQLLRKIDGVSERLVDIDELLCAELGEPVDPVRFVREWYIRVGLPLAVGHDWAWLKKYYEDDGPILTIIDFLEANYDVYAFRG